jgi:hypothetical protein
MQKASFALFLGLSLGVAVPGPTSRFAEGAPPAPQARNWTHVSGDYYVEARFITEKYGKIWLLRAGGGVFGVEPGELSVTDRQYVAGVMKERRTRKTPVTKNSPDRVPYGVGSEVDFLENTKIRESSGLARSRREAGFFWTHNDSGGDARVFLIDEKGRDRGSFLLKDTLAYDFEDIFSFSEEGKHYLVLCDVGNNGRAAPIQMLHLVEEPEFDSRIGLEAEQELAARTIYYSYEDDHRDCEAVGYDPHSKTILFVTKEREADCHVYALPMPEPNPRKAFSARKIATLKLPEVTGMDVSSDGRRVILSTYGHAYEFQRIAEQNWADAFAGEPREVVLPERVQGESICYSTDDKTLYLTSEKLPTPLIVIPVQTQPAAAQ